MAHRFTIGVEEEFQIVDPETGGLRSHVSQLMAATLPGLGDQVKPELHESIVEIGTKICANVSDSKNGLQLVVPGVQQLSGFHPVKSRSICLEASS